MQGEINMNKKCIRFLIVFVCALCLFSYGCHEEKEEETHNLVYYEMKEATCSEEGHIAYYQCTECHKYYKDMDAMEEITDVVIPKTPHQYDETYHCSICGEVKEHEHQYVWDNIKEPTCEEDGLKEGHCQLCGEETKEIINKLEHDYGEWIHVFEDGVHKHYRVCNNDNNHIEKEICNETSEVIEPTCDDGG